MARETGCLVEQVTDEDVIVNANHVFLCGENVTLWGAEAQRPASS